MAINLKAVREKVQETDFEYDGEKAKVWFRPNTMTPSLEKEIRRMQRELADQDELDKQEAGGRRYLDTFCRVVIDWEVLDEDGARVPITPEAISELPYNFLRAVLDACWSFDSTDPKAPGTSSDGQSKAD
jgi:hypothetical protein